MNRQPILAAGAVALVLNAVAVATLAFVHVTESQTKAVLALAGAVGVLVTAIWSQPRVTPLVDPRDDEGRTLVPKKTTKKPAPKPGD